LPPSTSKGGSAAATGSSVDRSTATESALVSRASQVRTAENDSPIRTALTLVRHQQWSGSDSTTSAAA